jgi:mRNA-degrading endonuclease RelE of RelBE toxin-antitoxin system
MKWRLLVALRALEFVEKLPVRVRKHIRTRLQEIEDHPESCSEYVEYDDKGRLLDACVCEGFAIIFWLDVPDRQIKVLRVEPADG